MSHHPTQIFLHHPSALRVELRLDDSKLLLWWSPKAGSSYDAADRNFSNRDDHLSVLESITLPDLLLKDFVSCDYDAYRAVVHFRDVSLTIELTERDPVVLLHATIPITIDFKSGRYDTKLAATPAAWTIAHSEPGGEFEFSVAMGPGEGRLNYAPMHARWNAHYAWATPKPGQVVALGVGLAGEGISERTQRLAATPLADIRTNLEARVQADLRQGSPVLSEAPVEAFYGKTRRSLHSAIDDSGAIRAALKPVYYLIWLRDGAFCFNYQAASGWLHRHEEWCRFLLANPMQISEPGLAPGRAFAQLVNKTYGKLEEDGIYYAVWSVFTHVIQTNRTDLLSGEYLATLRECLEWIEAYSFDAERGLFWSRFADESPVRISRDHGIDAAIGGRSPEAGIHLEGRLIQRSYDTYINSLMFSVYGMLGALPGVPEDLAMSSRAKASALWAELSKLFPTSGLPSYGELLMEDGGRVMAPPYKPSRSVYVWAFCLPGLAPIPNIDAIRLALLRDVMAAPCLHWLNGIAALSASVDPLTCDPEELHDVVRKLIAQGERSGRYLPMPGTLPEKYDAPDGNMYDDIRPQAFAQSGFLAACSSLGIRRLPFGLAARPTSFIRKWSAYAWRASELDFTFGASHKGIQINGTPVPRSLQIPNAAIPAGRVTISVGTLPEDGTLARSNVDLQSVTARENNSCTYAFLAPSAFELVFTKRPKSLKLSIPAGLVWTEESGLSFARANLPPSEKPGLITAEAIW